jgi:hypothetical protein
MPNSQTPPPVMSAVKGLMFAALTSPLVLLMRLPIDAWFSGLGLLRWLGPLPFRLVFSAVVAFVVLAALGLPAWLLYRRLPISPRWWHFAVLGIVIGCLLASRVDPVVYGSPDFRDPWARGGQRTIRPAVDAISLFLRGLLPGLVFWPTVYRLRLGKRVESEQR